MKATEAESQETEQAPRLYTAGAKAGTRMTLDTLFLTRWGGRVVRVTTSFAIRHLFARKPRSVEKETKADWFDRAGPVFGFYLLG